MVIFEDNDTFRKLLEIYLKGRGHNVVDEAGTMPQALGVVASLAAGEVIADVAVVDGNLSRGRIDGAEGAEIVQKLREIENLGTFAIYGMSSMGDIAGVDENISKDKVGKKLLELISMLPTPEYTEAA